jgi:hypothetical protein
MTRPTKELRQISSALPVKQPAYRLVFCLSGKRKRVLYNLPWNRRLGDKVVCVTLLLG